MAVLCMFCSYVAVDTLYVVLVVMFVVFWLVQLTTAAQVFEWVLLIIAGFLQILAISNHAEIQKLDKSQLEEENDTFIASNEKHGLLPTLDTVHKPAKQKHIKVLWGFIVLCVALNIIGIMIVAPPSTSQPSISAQLYTQTSLPFIFLTSAAACFIWYDWYLWTH